MHTREYSLLQDDKRDDHLRGVGRRGGQPAREGSPDDQGREDCPLDDKRHSHHDEILCDLLRHVCAFTAESPPFVEGEMERQRR